MQKSPEIAEISKPAHKYLSKIFSIFHRTHIQTFQRQRAHFFEVVMTLELVSECAGYHTIKNETWN